MNPFLMCALIFVLSFAAIWAFWFLEKMRGASAPQARDLAASITPRTDAKRR